MPISSAAYSRNGSRPLRMAARFPRPMPAMKLDRTIAAAQAVFPNARPARRNHSVSNNNAAAPERKNATEKLPRALTTCGPSAFPKKYASGCEITNDESSPSFWSAAACPLSRPAACCRQPRQAAAEKAAPRRRTPKLRRSLFPAAAWARLLFRRTRVRSRPGRES